MIPDGRLPERIGRLEELANNLWWSWHTQGRDLFRALDYPLWRLSGHNPVKQLREISPDKLAAAAGDPVFLNLYDSVITAFDADMSDSNSWFSTNYRNALAGPVAYLSMEFAIHSSIRAWAVRPTIYWNLAVKIGNAITLRNTFIYSGRVMARPTPPAGSVPPCLTISRRSTGGSTPST